MRYGAEYNSAGIVCRCVDCFFCLSKGMAILCSSHGVNADGAAASLMANNRITIVSDGAFCCLVVLEDL